MTKNTHLNLRLKKSQLDFLIHAASLTKQALPTFILNSALKNAEELVASQTQFKLSNHQWNNFCAILDKPASEIPKLRKIRHASPKPQTLSTTSPS